MEAKIKAALEQNLAKLFINICIKVNFVFLRVSSASRKPFNFMEDEILLMFFSGFHLATLQNSYFLE